MTKQVIRISVLQTSKVMTALYVLGGFLYTLIGIPMIIMGGEQIRIVGVVYLFMPVIMGFVGFVGFVIFAALYNLLAAWLGGVEFELKNIDPESTGNTSAAGEHRSAATQRLPFWWW